MSLIPLEYNEAFLKLALWFKWMMQAIAVLTNTDYSIQLYISGPLRGITPQDFNSQVTLLLITMSPNILITGATGYM
jgi:hypothetical protein